MCTKSSKIKLIHHDIVISSQVWQWKVNQKCLVFFFIFNSAYGHCAVCVVFQNTLLCHSGLISSFHPLISARIVQLFHSIHHRSDRIIWMVSVGFASIEIRLHRENVEMQSNVCKMNGCIWPIKCIENDNKWHIFDEFKLKKRKHSTLVYQYYYCSKKKKNQEITRIVLRFFFLLSTTYTNENTRRHTVL